MEGSDLEGPNCQPKVKKVENSSEDPVEPNHVEIEKNPFELQVILDILFKILSFDDVKKFRLVSSTWNQVGTVELSRRPQKPIKFDDIEEFEDDDKLGALVQLQKRHDLIFPNHHHQLFTKFSINIALLLWTDNQLSHPIFDLFIEFFKPTFVQLYGFLVYHPQASSEVDKISLPHLLCKFLVKISSTVQEIDFDKLGIELRNQDKVVELTIAIAEELTRTRFPYLAKISNNIAFIEFQKMYFYPIIGQNSPKLSHLLFESSSFIEMTFINNRENLDEEVKEMKAKFESTGLMYKLKYLDLLDVRTELIELFAEFGQRGQLKLTKLNYKNNSNRNKEIFVRLVSNQGEFLKFLKISTPYQLDRTKDYTIQIPFPKLQNLTILQIDYFSSFRPFFKPINFSLQLPKLEEFRTFDLETFLEQDLGESGSSVKSLFFMGPSFYNNRINFNKIYGIFPNLEFLDLNFDFLPLTIAQENVHFWSQLRIVRIHSNKLKNLYEFYPHVHFLKEVKKVEIVLDCGDNLVEDSYKNLFSKIVNEKSKKLDHFRRDKFYQKCLASISKDLILITHLTSISFIGYKISEDFKRDFRAILPDCTFVNCPFKDS